MVRGLRQSEGDTPAYACSKCGVHGVKLWRLYQSFATKCELMCGSCSLVDQGKSGEIDDSGKRESDLGSDRTDQIGWRVPAVPTENGGMFWGYTSVPESGVKWWRALPTNREPK